MRVEFYGCIVGKWNCNKGDGPFDEGLNWAIILGNLAVATKECHANGYIALAVSSFASLPAQLSRMFVALLKDKLGRACQGGLQ